MTKLARTPKLPVVRSGAGSCPPGWCGEAAADVAAACSENGWPYGHPVTVTGPDGVPCQCTCPIPPCSAELCRVLQPDIEEYCTALGLPPGYPFLCLDASEGLCFCTCGGSAGEAAHPEPEALRPCSAEECAELRPRIEAALRRMGWPAGQPVLVRNAEGGICLCRC